MVKFVYLCRIGSSLLWFHPESYPEEVLGFELDPSDIDQAVSFWRPICCIPRGPRACVVLGTSRLFQPTNPAFSRPVGSENHQRDEGKTWRGVDRVCVCVCVRGDGGYSLGARARYCMLVHSARKVCGQLLKDFLWSQDYPESIKRHARELALSSPCAS